MRDRIIDVLVMTKLSDHAETDLRLVEGAADALLEAFPVLSGPSDAEVEAGARAVDPAAWDESQWQVGGRENVLPESEGARAAREEARGLARAVLVAARDARTT